MQTLNQSSETSNKHVCTKHCLHETKGPTSDYWRSPKGITRRIDMLAQGLTYKVVNNSLMFYGQSAGIQWVRWSTMADERVCPICGPLEGRIYRKGQFLPPLPAHSACRCRWELILTQTPEAPTVDRIILPGAEGYDISASTWQSMVKILSTTIVSLLILTADQTESRVGAYKELEQMMRNRGYNFIIMDIPDDEEEEQWWLNRGFIRDGERLVRRLN